MTTDDPTLAAAVPTVAAGKARHYEVIVVGAGHNGLVAAAYLARAGRSVLVLERRTTVGGTLVSVELVPGVRAPAVAHTVGRLSPAVARDLELRSHGLTLLAPSIRAFAPQPDGRAVVLDADAAATADGLRAWSAGDADAFPEFDRRVRTLARFLAALADETPPDIRVPGIGDALAGLRLGRSFRGLGKVDGRTVLRVLPMAVADFVAEAVESDPVRAVLAWRGVRYTAMGPWSAGTAKVLLDDSAGNDGGATGETVYARGGPGALAEALAAAVRRHGGTIRTDSEVAGVTSRDGRVTGVVLASGEEIVAPVVVGGIDPKRLLTGLVDPVALGPSLRWRAGNLRTPGAVAKVNLVLDGLPDVPAAADDPRRLRGRILVGLTGIDDVERAFDAAKYGRMSDEPVLEATIPSLADPSLVSGAPEGTHVMSVLAQWVPYRLGDGDWDSRRDELGDRVLARLETVAPGITGRVRARQVLTPVDLERDYGLTGGHPLHVEPGLESFFLWRPLLGWARYRMPVEGLYLAGSGAHPGGGVNGLPGRNAAREVLADLRRRR
ncbi:MAG TPA: NAD(P)/FAD-dependent oxidoreductase [Candidatus Limnocylindrales bacterium]|nr:NAD(P)/FAD-dependent oxidoreductase [Candidatus Limnocylindrales bacterium]